MHAHGLLIGGEARHQVSVRGRGRVGIDHREEVVALGARVTGPDKLVVIWSFRHLLLSVRRNVEGADDKGGGEQDTRHGELRY
jgi:hypothetical protein